VSRIAYRFTSSAALGSISEFGLLSKADRDAQNGVKKSNFHGAVFGDGVYVGRDEFLDFAFLLFSLSLSNRGVIARTPKTMHQPQRTIPQRYC